MAANARHRARIRRARRGVSGQPGCLALPPAAAAERRRTPRIECHPAIRRPAPAPLEMQVEDRMDNGGQLVRVASSPDMPAPAGRMLWQSQPCPARPGNCTWCTTRTTAWPTAAGPVPPARRLAGPGAAGAVCAPAPAPRPACASAAARELETVLQQHAQELRTAQDGIVQAAQQAAQQTDTGLSRSLEHLPQGVVIIDADLKLVA